MRLDRIRRNVLTIARRLYGSEASLNEDTAPKRETKRELGLHKRWHFAWIEWPDDVSYRRPQGDGPTMREAIENLEMELRDIEKAGEDSHHWRGRRVTP